MATDWAGPVIYMDTLFFLAVLCFLMDFLLLWATARVSRLSRPPNRIALGALLGTAYFVAYYIAAHGGMRQYGWLQSWPMLLVVSGSMLAIALAPMPRRQFFRVGGYYYFIAVSSGGAGLAVGYALGWNVPLQLLTAIGAILIIAELGWGVLQKSLWQHLYHVPLEITLFGRSIQTKALIDTGNRLRDPLSGAGVIVVELDALAPIMPDAIRNTVNEMGSGDFHVVSRLLSSERWSSRFRVVPFRSLGKDNGMLVGFKPDSASVVFDGARVSVDETTIAIYPQTLDADGEYQALLHPEALPNIHGEATDTQPAPTTNQKGESPHAHSL